jgi:hypothetical protein
VDKPRWTVEISPEIETWYASLKSKDKAMAGRGFDRLAEHGPALRMPHAGRSAAGCTSCGSPARAPPAG